MLVKHPDADPATITEALGLMPNLSWKRGDRLIAPNGKEMPITGRETKWSVSFENDDRLAIGAFVDAAVRSLPEPGKLWTDLLDTGAKASLILMVVGTKYQGAEISHASIVKLAEMGISLGLEVYAVPQN